MNTDITMTRLREANPVRESPNDLSGELFASIVARPGDPRLRTPRPAARRGHRRALTIGIVVVVAALLASTAVAAYRELYSAPIVKPDVSKQEYEQATHELTLPPGERWPQFTLPPDSDMAQGGGGSQAVMISQVRWECYWVGAIERGDTAAQARAHHELETILDKHIVVAPDGAAETWAPQPIPAVPFAVFVDDGGLQFKRRMYADAAGGHPQMLRQSCIANG